MPALNLNMRASSYSLNDTVLSDGCSENYNKIVTARMLHRAWWLTQRNTLCELWRACPWPGNTSLQHNPSERFNAPISRDCPQTRLRRDLGTSIWRRVEWLPPATSLKCIFVRWPHPTSHMCITLTTRGVSQRFLWNDVHGVVRPSDVFPVNLILLLKAMAKTRKTRALSFAALWREPEDVTVCRLSGTGGSAMRFTCRWGLKHPSQRHREQQGSSGAERGVWEKDRSQHGTVTSDAPNPEQNNCQQQWTEHFKIFRREEFECFFFFLAERQKYLK